MDFAMTASINPAQYVMLGMMVCNHLTFKTGVKHQLGDFSHFVQNVHIYNKHLEAAKYLLEEANTVDEQPTLALNCEAKDFYDHTIEDFDFNIPKGIKKLPFKLEIAV
jgi:thymidylate synthase